MDTDYLREKLHENLDLAVMSYDSQEGHEELALHHMELAEREGQDGEMYELRAMAIDEMLSENDDYWESIY